MFKKKRLFIVFIAVSFFVHAQTNPWQQTPMPFNGEIFTMTTIGDTIFAGGFGGIFSSTDHGQSWNHIFSSMTVLSLKSNGTNLYAGGDSWSNGSVYWSSDAGQTWTYIKPYIYSAPYNIWAMLVNGSDLFIAASGGGTVYKCPLANLSQFTWTTYATGFTVSGYPITSFLFNGTNILAGSFTNGIWSSPPTTASWSNTSTGLTNTNFLRAMAINNNTVFAGFAGSPQIARSVNNGASWSPITTSAFSANSEVRAIITDNQNIYTGTNLDGVVYSNDNGISWTGYNDGFKDNSGNWYCNNMRINSLLKLNDTLFAGTSCGVWKSSGCSKPVDITPNNNLKICSGNSTQLNVTGLGTINWFTQPNSTISIATGSNYITPSLTTTTTFYLENDFCNSRTPITVTISPFPNINLTPSSFQICVDEPVTITASGADAYTWNTAATTSVITEYPQSTTIYSVVGVNQPSCSSTQSIQISVLLCAGISSHKNPDQIISCFPNPGTGKFTFSGLDGETKLEIYDLMGNLIYSTKSNDKDISIDLEGNEKGIYSYRISTSEKETWRGKLIVI